VAVGKNTGAEVGGTATVKGGVVETGGAGMAGLYTAGANEGGGVGGGGVGTCSVQPISRPLIIKANVKNINPLESLALLLTNKKTSSRIRLNIRWYYILYFD
jgi:hypothetical protein